MARIDLKRCTVFLVDGYTEDDAQVSGTPAADAVTMTITGAPAANIPIGTLFTVAGSGRIHQITARSGGPPNTSITFTPGLTDALSNGAAITFLGRGLIIKVGDGEVNYEETKTREYELDRGELDDVVDGDDEPMTVNLSMKWEEIASAPGATFATPEEALKQKGAAADWESTDSDECRPYAIDIIIEHVPRCSTGYVERVTLPEFRHESLPHNYNDGTINVTGRCNATEAIVERIALNND
jgi:hypothetical protein